MQTLEMTKEETLWEKLKEVRVFSSHMVREIGFKMFYDRADRTCRQWAFDGKLRRISKEECLSRGLNRKGLAPLAWWEIV